MRFVLELDCQGPDFDRDPVTKVFEILGRVQRNVGLNLLRGKIRDSHGTEIGCFALQGNDWRQLSAEPKEED